MAESRGGTGLGRLGLVLSVLAPSIALAVAVSWLLDMELWEEAFLSSLSGLLSALLIALSLIDERYEARIAGSLARAISGRGKEALALLYLFSLLCVIFIPPVGSSELYIAWQAIPAINWLRLLASLLLIGFLPGAVLIELVLKPGRRPWPERWVASYFLSLFLYVLLYELCLALGLERPSGLTSLLLIANGLLLGGFVANTLLELKRRRAEGGGEFPGEDMVRGPSLASALESLMLITTSALVVAGAAIIAAHYSPLVRGDMWTVHGCSRRFYMADLGKGDFTADHQWYMYIACYFALSGIPTANAFTALLAFGPIIYMAFYLMAKAALGRRGRRLPILATLLALMAGYGWAYFLYLRDFSGLDVGLALEKAADLTYDIWYPFLMFPRIVTRKFHAAIPGLFFLCYLMLERDMPKRFRYSLMAVTAAICFVFHVFEELFFLLIFTAYHFLTWLRGRLDLRALRSDCLTLFTGGLLSVGLDLASPHPCHLIPALIPMLTITIALAWPLALIPLAYVLQRIRPALIEKLRGLRKLKGPSWLKPFMGFLLLYAYILSFVIVLGGYGPDFMLFTIVPLYYYPMKLGLVGTLFLIYLLLPRNERLGGDTAFFIALLMSYSAIILAIRMWAALMKPSALYAEFRYFTLVFAPLCLASAASGEALVRRIRGFKKGLNRCLIGSFLSIFMFIGMASNLLSIEMWAMKGSSYPEGLFHAASHVASAVQPGRSVLALSPFSWEVLTFSGMRDTQITPGLYEGYRAFISAEKMGTYLALLSRACVSYAFTTGADAYFARDSFFMRLSKYLKPVIEATGTYVFEVPPISGPEPGADLVLLRQSALLVLAEDFDDYARGDVPPGWISEGSCGVEDGEMHLRGNATCTIDKLELPSFKLMVKIVLLGLYSPEARARIYFGMSGPDEFYSIDIYTDRLVLMACSGGEEKELYEGPALLTLGVPAFLAIEVRGMYVSVLVDNMYIIEGELPGLPEGPIALGSRDCHVAFDELEIYQLFPEELSYESASFILALSGLRFSISMDYDPRAFDADTILMADGLYEDVSAFLRFAEEGGKLVVLDSVGLGAIAANLSISKTGDAIEVNGILVAGEHKAIPELSIRALSCRDEDVDVIARFTFNGTPVAPYAFKRSLGSGEVVYLHVYDYLKALHVSPDKWRFFYGLEALGAVLLGEEGLSDVARFPCTMEGLTELRGDVILRMRSLLTNGGASFLNVSAEVEPGGPSIDNTDVDIIELRGQVEVEARLPTARISGQRGFPCTYTRIVAPDGGEIVLTASGNGLIVTEVKGLGRLTIRDGALRIAFSNPLSFYANALQAVVEGRASFERLWCYRAGSSISVRGAPVDIEGEVEFSIVATDIRLLVLEGLKVEGEVSVKPTIPVELLPILEVRWGDLLLSDKNLLALTVAYVLVATWLLRRVLLLEETNTSRKPNHGAGRAN